MYSCFSCGEFVLPHIHNIIQGKKNLIWHVVVRMLSPLMDSARGKSWKSYSRQIACTERVPAACLHTRSRRRAVPDGARARCWQTFNSRALLLGAHYSAAARLPESLLTTVFTFIAFLVGENIC